MKKALFGVIVSIMGVLAMLATPTLAVGSQLCDDLSAGTPEYAAAGCGSQKDVGQVANAVIEVVLGFAGVIAVGVMIYGGFLFLTSSGDAGKVKKGQDSIKYGIIGLIVSVLAYVIVAFVSGMVAHG